MNIKNKFGLAIHGGTASFTLNDIKPSTKKIYSTFFEKLIEYGYKKLTEGYLSIEIIEEIICKLEDSGLFNAGRGSITSENGFPSMDASIMDGNNINYGSISGITNIKNPITLTKIIMEKMEGCYSFNDILNSVHFSKYCQSVSKEYFNIKKLWLDQINDTFLKKASTVGCVALDKKGNLAAGTSTGGLIKKNPGRISDSSYLGAGTYANNKTCAISCSGHGETIIKTLLAFSIHSKISLLDVDLGKAIDMTFDEYQDLLKFNVGLIGINQMGKIYVKYNSNMMYYAYRSTITKYISNFNDNLL